MRNKPKNIVYLFGAGATHAEIMNLINSPEFSRQTAATLISKYGLKISDVSKRVMKSAQKNSRFKKDVEEVKSLFKT